MKICNQVLINDFRGGFPGTDGMPIQSICCTNWRDALLQFTCPTLYHLIPIPSHYLTLCLVIALCSRIVASRARLCLSLPTQPRRPVMFIDGTPRQRSTPYSWRPRLKLVARHGCRAYDDACGTWEVDVCHGLARRTSLFPSFGALLCRCRLPYVAMLRDKFWVFVLERNRKTRVPFCTQVVEGCIHFLASYMNF
jgi:hypothetical protein